MRRRLPILAAVLMLFTLGGAVVLARSGSLPKDLQDVRAAVARYHDVSVATAAGYIPASPCEQTAAGAMGVHYMKPALLGPGLDPLNPEVLLYMPQKNGSLQLVGVEYFQADADQNLSTSQDRPSLFGRGFDGPMLGHNPQMPIHYDLHVWVVEQNPSGVFAQYNPSIHCP
jgi:hypothetical protein